MALVRFTHIQTSKAYTRFTLVTLSNRTTANSTAATINTAAPVIILHCNCLAVYFSIHISP